MRVATGIFVTGNDTDVGKTHIAAMIARAVRAAGLRVGVYKPAASGCRQLGETLVADDAVALWQAAGKPGTLDRVCPQRFIAPLAPHLAALAEGKTIDRELLRSGLEYWRAQSDFIVVEGAGGLMSPIGDQEYVADLAHDFQLPLLIVVKNKIGAINQALQTELVAASYRGGLTIAGVVLNRPTPTDDDPSLPDNRRELERHLRAPVLAEISFGQSEFPDQVALPWGKTMNYER